MKKILVNITLIFLFANLFSQKVVDTLQINEIKVTATKIKNDDKSTVPLQSLTKNQLSTLSSNNLADAIKNFSGVIIKDYGGIGGLKTLMVRSLGANHTSVFIDGVQYSDVATGQVDLGKLSTDNANEISLLVGQPNFFCQPARFYSSASVISINTAIEDLYSKKTSFQTSFKTGSFGLYNPSVSIKSKIGTSVFTDFFANSIKANGIYPFYLKYGNNKDTNLLRTNSDIFSTSVNATVFAKFKDSSVITLKFYYYWSERGLPGAVVFYNPFASQRLWNKDFFSNFQYKSNKNKRFELLSNIKFSTSKVRYIDPYYLNSEQLLENNYLQNEFYFSQAFAYKISKFLSISLATDFFLNTLTANLPNYANPLRFTNLNVVSVNFSNNNLDFSAYLLNTDVKEQTEIGNAAKPLFKLNSSFNFGYKIFNIPNLKIRFLYKDIFRMPTFNDLYYSMVGNVNLKPENAKQFNLGFVAYNNLWFFDYFSSKIDFFYNLVTDKIVAIPTKNLFVWSMRNIGTVDIKGLELQTNLQTNDIMTHLKLYASYTYSLQKAIDITDPSTPTYKNQIPYIPFETASILVSLIYKQFSVSYNTLFNGFRYVLGENIYENMLPSFWVSDVVILYNFSLKKSDFGIKFEINNVFNKQYQVIKSFPMPRRAYFVSISTKF